MLDETPRFSQADLRQRIKDEQARKATPEGALADAEDRLKNLRNERDVLAQKREARVTNDMSLLARRKMREESPETDAIKVRDAKINNVLDEIDMRKKQINPDHISRDERAKRAAQALSKKLT